MYTQGELAELVVIVVAEIDYAVATASVIQIGSNFELFVFIYFRTPYAARILYHFDQVFTGV